MTHGWITRLLQSPVAQALMAAGWSIESVGINQDTEDDGDDEHGRPIIIMTSSPWVRFFRGGTHLYFYRSRWGDTAYTWVAGHQVSSKTPEQFATTGFPARYFKGDE